MASAVAAAPPQQHPFRHLLFFFTGRLPKLRAAARPPGSSVKARKVRFFSKFFFSPYTITDMTRSKTVIVRGKHYVTYEGSKAQVWHGTAYATKGGVTKDQLLQKENGRIVFKSRSEAALKGKGFQALLTGKDKNGNPLVCKKGETPAAFKKK